MFHDPLLLRLQGTTFAIGFLKLKRNLKEKCEHYGKSNKGKSNWIKKARELHDFRNVWSHDGKILFLVVNDRNMVKVFYDWYLNSWFKSAV